MHGKYDAGFTAKLQLKDIRLYLENARAAGIADEVASTVVGVWEKMNADLPGADITEMYPYTRNGAGADRAAATILSASDRTRARDTRARSAFAA